jgi:hypothetical protein
MTKRRPNSRLREGAHITAPMWVTSLLSMLSVKPGKSNDAPGISAYKDWKGEP